jgi:hypothetical protein
VIISTSVLIAGPEKALRFEQQGVRCSEHITQGVEIDVKV